MGEMVSLRKGILACIVHDRNKRMVLVDFVEAAR